VARPQDGRPAAVLYPFGHLTPYVYDPLAAADSGRRFGNWRTDGENHSGTCGDNGAGAKGRLKDVEGRTVRVGNIRRSPRRRRRLHRRLHRHCLHFASPCRSFGDDVLSSCEPLQSHSHSLFRIF
jgi:hypothetical protein